MLSSHSFLLASLIPEFVNRNLGWWLFALSVVLGVAFGAADMARFSWSRVWALGKICSVEAHRRKVYWITPLAILGVVIVSQLQRPLDEQDAIRQTVKFCLFATGLVVATTTIILACTNLPREIDNRVIYTVVTKPTTRLEIVIGKVIGFARVSAVILIIMGVFSFGYLCVRSWTMQRALAQRLETGDIPVTSVVSAKYYRDAGLLNAKKIELPDDVQIYGRMPDESTGRRYMAGAGEGSVQIPFDVDPAKITPAGSDEPGSNGLVVIARVGYVKQGAATQPAATPAPATTQPVAGATTVPYYGPFVIPPEERQRIMAGAAPVTEPGISIEVLDANQNHLGSAVPPPPLKVLELHNRDGLSEVPAYIDPKIAKQLKGRIFIRVTGLSADVEYYVDPSAPRPPVSLGVISDPPLPPLEAARDAKDPKLAAAPIFQGRSGTFGQQLRGGKDRQTVAIFGFRDAPVKAADGKAPFEMRVGIERSGADEPENPEFAEPTTVSVRVRNHGTGQVSDEAIVQPESNRTVFFTMPASAMEGGNFDLLVRCLTKSDYLGLAPKSIVLITAQQPFAWNLFKSLLILWLMAILITAVAIFTSTFLSWPIAVVLTLVILLGHWGVQQLGDATAPGIGAQVVTDFQVRDPAKAEAVKRTVENLSSFLNFIATILPDISRYAAVEDIERGISIPMDKMRDSLLVTLGFGVPLVLLAYVFLKNKEVAP